MEAKRAEHEGQHNPCNVPIGCIPDGWRLMTKSEAHSMVEITRRCGVMAKGDPSWTFSTYDNSPIMEFTYILNIEDDIDHNLVGHNGGIVAGSQLPDTGSRTEFATGAVRDAMEGKGFPSMIPPIAIRAIAKRFEDGCKSKYPKHNWMKGIPLSRYYDSIQRHALSWSEGKTDEDHGGAVLWNMSCAMWTLDQIEQGNLPAELNDLPYYKK